MIPYGRQSISDADIASVVEVLQSDYLTQGPLVDQFENAICKKVKAKHCTAVNSATSALHLACLALGINSKSLVWTTPISFVSSSNCARYCGSKIDFVDIDFDTHNISINALKEKLANSEINGSGIPDLIIVVHMAGLSCDMKAVSQLAKQYGFKVIEDASHCIGGTYDGMPIGNCQYSDAVIFSFHPVKIITTGEGGAITTNCKEMDTRVKRLRSHGITRDRSLMTMREPWCYEQKELGFNYRITDIQCALGLSQLARLEEFIESRRSLAKLYKKRLEEVNVILPNVIGSEESAWHLYIIKLKDCELKSEYRKNVFNYLRNNGIGVNVHYIPIYKQPYYQSMGFSFDYCEVAERYYQCCITLPLHPQIKETQLDFIVHSLQKAV